MHCVGMILPAEKYNLSKPIGVLEDKKTVAHVHGSHALTVFTMMDLDVRLLSLFSTSLSDMYQGFIIVSDFEHFFSDKEVMEAIIWHEIGHLSRPVYEGAMDVEAEIFCDRLSFEKTGIKGIRNLLEKTLEMGVCLKNDRIIEMTQKRIHALSEYI